MNEIKDIFESLSSRIRSPYFGYFVIFSISLNWKSWLLLIWDDFPLQERIVEFEQSTSFLCLILIPFILGIISALITPWLKLAIVKVNSIPTAKNNLEQAKAESNLLEQKALLEKNRDNILAVEEDKLIGKAKRDEEIRSIEDAESRERLEEEVQRLRSTQGFTQGAFGTVKGTEDPQLNVELRKTDSKHGRRFYVTNNGAITAYEVMFSLIGLTNDNSPLVNDYEEVFPVPELHPGDEVSVIAAIDSDSPLKFDAKLTWKNSDGIQNKKIFTITYQ